MVIITSLKKLKIDKYTCEFTSNENVRGTEMNLTQGYFSLCYHYVRPEKENDEFPKLLGTRVNEFKKQISMFEENYKMISLKNVEDFSYKNYKLGNTLGMLITFDDGLADHYLAAKILEKKQIKAVFFIPSCISEDNLPANPIIIHYSIAKFGIKKFLDHYESSLKKFQLNKNSLKISYNPQKDDPWKLIDKIKTNFKYKFNNHNARKILINIYENLLIPSIPNFMEKAHLSNEQIKEILEMGHSIGGHTHTHISVPTTLLNSDEFNKEIILSKKSLEKRFHTNIISFSYPYGEEKDCLSTKKFLKNTNFKIAFTVKAQINNHKTPPLEIGRYEPYSNDTSLILKEMLIKLREENK